MSRDKTMQPTAVNPTPVFEMIRSPGIVLRSLNAAVLLFFITTFYAPSALAIKTGIEESEKAAAVHASLPENKSELARYTLALQRMKGHFKEAERLYVDAKASVIGQVTDIENAIETGDSLFRQDARWRAELAQGLAQGRIATALDARVNDDFAAVEGWINRKGLGQEYQQRHQQAYGQYRQRYTVFDEHFTALARAQSEDQTIAALKELNAYLADQQFGRKHQPYDDATLGNSAPVSASGKPLLLSKRDYFYQGMEANPKVQLAVAGDFVFDALPGADDPAYLAETDEVVLSAAVQQKAAELQHDPVNIHHWVRNNIETIPGWGSYQNADLTLAAQRGNPMDVASLLIALLRASGIPARYAIGVAEMDADVYNNWLGNFASATVASNYANSNGIATQSVVSGGQVTRIRTQHIWVQAAIDYFPSRGAKNRSADAWIDIDPSFKQYEYQAGLDAIQITGIDAEALANQFIESGTVEEAQGYVQNLDPTELLNAQTQAQQALEEYIENNLTDPTVGDVIGGRRTIIQAYPTLPSALPYSKYFQGPTYGALPSALQNKATLGVGSNTTTFPFARINNQKVSLKFTPATAADEQALAALLPEGEITDVSQLPSSIPSYLVNVIPELALNGTVFAQGTSMQLGQEIDVTYQISGPNAQYASYPYIVAAGSFLNIPIVAQSVSPALLEGLQTKVENTRAILESGDEAQIGTLTREDLLGDLFYAGGLGYFAQYNGLSHIAALQSQGHHKLEFGYGSVGYEPNVNTFFGVTRAITTGGAAANIRLANIVETTTGNKDQRNQLRFQAGLISSALEHAILEQMFSDPNNPTDGVSAVKALQLAAQQGQKIYQITQDNVNAALSDITLNPEVEAEIRNAVTQGRTVITHTSNIQVPGWSGAGYVILDSETLAGSYKISGGGNGGILRKVKQFLNKLIFNIALLYDAGPKLSLIVRTVPQIGVVLNALSIISGIIDSIERCPNGFDVFKGVAVVMFVLFLSAMVFAISVANPFLGLAILAVESAVWGRVQDTLVEAVCE